MFALILLISVQGLTVFMLPNAVPNTMHAQTDRQTDRIAGPIVHKPQWYWYLRNSELCEFYNDAICSNEINHV